MGKAAVFGCLYPGGGNPMPSVIFIGRISAMVCGRGLGVHVGEGARSAGSVGGGWVVVVVAGGGSGASSSLWGGKG